MSRWRSHAFAEYYIAERDYHHNHHHHHEMLLSQKTSSSSSSPSEGIRTSGDNIIHPDIITTVCFIAGIIAVSFLWRFWHRQANIQPHCQKNQRGDFKKTAVLEVCFKVDDVNSRVFSIMKSLFKSLNTNWLDWEQFVLIRQSFVNLLVLIRQILKYRSINSG